jgi:hypothetical protein
MCSVLRGALGKVVAAYTGAAVQNLCVQCEKGLLPHIPWNFLEASSTFWQKVLDITYRCLFGGFVLLAMH